jgi:hypothetical protein
MVLWFVGLFTPSCDFGESIIMEFPLMWLPLSFVSVLPSIFGFLDCCFVSLVIFFHIMNNEY